MDKSYDSHNFRIGEYSLNQIENFASNGRISQEDVMWRIKNVGAIIENETRLLVKGLVDVAFGTEDSMSSEQKNIVSTALSKQDIGIDPLPCSSGEWEDEKNLYYSQGLIPAGYISGRLEFDHSKIPFDEIKKMYASGLVSSDYVNKRLKENGDSTPFFGIDLMYEHKLIDSSLVEERASGGPSTDEWAKIKQYYPKVFGKFPGKAETHKKMVNNLLGMLEDRI